MFKRSQYLWRPPICTYGGKFFLMYRILRVSSSQDTRIKEEPEDPVPDASNPLTRENADYIRSNAILAFKGKNDTGEVF